ncbi:hypothetical protein POM88_034168 [Heracleum sosnowskyi]|uniref:Uncharacterized protein n=1 Tax=Heracleum sosnowskyi TaxID=360622 RepID=A0AAD8HJ03_9APIA|nr:hypothetical protein POM88_034168 [Heracleum sosnowskyi]
MQVKVSTSRIMMMVAEQQNEHEDDNVTSKRTKKVKRHRVEIGAGLRTRSRATKLPDPSQMKEPDAGATLEVNKAPVVSLKEKLNNLRNGPGSMTAYLALCEQEKLDPQKEIPREESEMQHLQSQSVEKPVDEALKRQRGQTKMNHVHNRAEKKRITLSYLNQPIADDGKLLSEFTNFLGTTEISKRNPEARQKITETHTTASTSFAQVAHMLRLEKLAKLEKEKQEKLGKMSVNGDGEGEGNGEEDPIKVSEADIYLANRKRDKNREYKLPEQVLKTVNDKINPELKLDTTEDSEKSANSEKSAEVSYEDDNDVNTD